MLITLFFYSQNKTFCVKLLVIPIFYAICLSLSDLSFYYFLCFLYMIRYTLNTSRAKKGWLPIKSETLSLKIAINELDF